VSKNVEADVLEVFSKRPDMRLKPHHVVAHRINWLPKAANIRSLAEELNLGLDSFVFLDDNPIECAQMQSELPQVVTIQVPPGPEIPRLLRHIWNFDKLATTTEDANRTRMYRENSARRAMESSAASIEQFIAALDLKVDIAEPLDDEWPRVEQLTQRTNQFNFTTRRRTASELKSLVADGAHVLRVRVSDRFGDYGLVGAMVARPSGREIVVDTLLLSCRVLGRGVEHAMVRMLGERALRLDLEAVLLPFIATSRNVPARAFADSIAAEFATPGDNGAVYRIPSRHASLVAHQPGHDPAEIIEARLADEKKMATATGGSERSEGISRSARYSRLANVLISGGAVLAQMSAGGRRGRQVSGTPVPPGSPLETELLEIWGSVLGIDGLGVEDDYFASGGTSLLSVKLFAEIERRFGAQLRLTTILEAPTVRTLARSIAPSAARDRDGLVCLRRGGSRNLFLVHDGFGETLLYLNLAKRLPPTMSVYGIEPRRLPGIPLAHASIEEMGRFYVERIQQVQPRGPYLLGGMCAGGVIAYEMAACLIGKGELVQMVTILDGATPQAAKRIGRITRNRLSRLGNALSQGAAADKSAPRQWLQITGALARKVRNVAVYESSSLLQRLSVRLRFALLKILVRRGAAWPSSVPQLSVMQIYNVLEARYRPPSLADVPVLLVRASSGDGLDTPYREVYRDEDFGWRLVANRLELVDVVGGHSSMLQERGIESLTAALLARLTALPGTVSELAI
jgi:FkbH-like protein